MASIIEWETGIQDEKPRVAGVYLNRLRINMPFQADPTVQYAILQSEGARRRLLFEDYRINHPYNTYQRQGLPPGPLNNPSPVIHPFGRQRRESRLPVLRGYGGWRTCLQPDLPGARQRRQPVSSADAGASARAATDGE
jgi:hypothetical protein